MSRPIAFHTNKLNFQLHFRINDWRLRFRDYKSWHNYIFNNDIGPFGIYLIIHRKEK